jgi:inner membrane protein
MDPISQGALGAALSASAARRDHAGAALGLGALSGMAADLDTLIRSDADPLLFLEYHRHFTHALAFIPLGALVCAAALYFVSKRRLRFLETYLFCLLGYATHGLLDACTSYGTALFWPFSDERIAWNFISVVDPLLTLPVLGLLLFAWRYRRPRYAQFALVWVAVYLSIGAVQRFRAEDAGLALAQSRGHAPERLTVKPAFGNVVLWKTIYAHDGWYHVDAVRLGIDARHAPGERVPRLDLARDVPWLRPDSLQASDVARFRRFSDDYLSLDGGDPTAIVDIRYSMVPNEVDALWGIRLHPTAAAERHVEFFTRRDATPARRRALIELLWPRDD